MKSKNKYFLIGLLVVAAVAGGYMTWRLQAPSSDFQICSSAQTSDKVLVHTTDCYYDSCSFEFFDMDGKKIGSFGGDGSAEGETRERAKYIKDDCKNISSGEFYSRVKISK